MDSKKVTPKQAKVEAPSRSSGSASLTQASSISTGGSGSHIMQAPDGATNWLDWYNNNFPAGTGNQTYPYPNQAANPNPYPSQPANPNQNANPNPYAGQQPSADASQFAQQVFELVNKERSNAGLSPLTMNSGLSNVAMAKAQDMYNNNYFDHQSPTYGSPFDMMKQFGITYNSAGENIAKGQTSATEVMNQWMNSPGHRANILNASFTQIGVAYYNSEWVQEFTG